MAQRPLTWRAILIAVVLTIAGGVWVRQAEIVVLATQITESVPAIPALAALFLLLGLNPLLRWMRPEARLGRVEVLAIYIFVAIAISMAGCGVIRYWLASVTYPFYYATPESGLATLQQWIPRWMAPHDPAVVQGLYLGSGAVPWGAWLIPLLTWSGFFLAAWCAMLCLVALVQRRWLQEERLSFPLVELVLQMTEPGRAGEAQRPFFLNPVMWIGFGAASLYNVINILHAFYPAVPQARSIAPLGWAAPGSPWAAMFPLPIVFNPLLMGLGFLVSTEISFSLWLFFLIYRLQGVLVASLGYRGDGATFSQEQSIGAFVILGLGLLWAARGSIRRAFAEMCGRAAHPADPDEPLARRWAIAGLMVSSLLVFLFFRLAGLVSWVAVAYMALLGLVALVCARIRAEAGLPLVWAFPFWMQKKVLLYTLGTALLMPGGHPGVLTVLALLAFVSRGYFPALIGYQADAFKISEQTRMKAAHMVAVVLLALVVGLGVAYYFHFVPYYRFGAVNLSDGSIWGKTNAQDDFSEVVNAVHGDIGPSPARIIATAWGVIVTGALVWLRRTFVGFPLHPIGFAVATAYGQLVWFPFFLVWLYKVLVLRYGGMRLYQASIPGFLGFAVGHIFAAGVVWGLVGAAIPKAVLGYQVIFG